MQKIAEGKGGKCLSTEYINAHTKLKWQCKEGHIWKAVPCNIKNNNRWCSICFHNSQKLTIKEMQKIAEEWGGKCLSTKYFNNNTKIKWQCKEGHIWESEPDSIKNGHHWCPICHFNSRRLTIKEMQKIAEKRGGKCLSTKYINANTRLRWQCKEGHIWEATPSDIKSHNTWCPICFEYKFEKKCRKIFEKIFSKQFSKKRPKWLISNKNGYMELDGYNFELKLAFEYNGIQHYRFINYFHKNINNFLKQQERDIKKIKLCEKYGVTLIIIPHTVKYKDLESYIIEQLEKKNMIISNLYSRNIQTEITSF